jgi:hypothetical protein
MNLEYHECGLPYSRYVWAAPVASATSGLSVRGMHLVLGVVSSGDRTCLANAGAAPVVDVRIDWSPRITVWDHSPWNSCREA